MFELLEPGQRYSSLDQSTKNNLSFPKSFNSKIILNRCRRLPIHEPSWTLVAHIGIDGYEYIHPTEKRTLSVREAKDTRFQ